jgi:hypothetical protein
MVTRTTWFLAGLVLVAAADPARGQGAEPADRIIAGDANLSAIGKRLGQNLESQELRSAIENRSLNAIIIRRREVRNPDGSPRGVEYSVLCGIGKSTRLRPIRISQTDFATLMQFADRMDGR